MSFIFTAVLGVFGLVTLFMSTSVIFDLFNIRAHQGHYVLFVVWANFFSGLLFIAAAFAFWKRKDWARVPLIISLALLIITFVGLLLHIFTGGAYETKTIGAMIFRIAVNGILLWATYSLLRKPRVTSFFTPGVVLLFSLGMLAAGCGKHNHNHDQHQHAIESEDSHHHGAHEGPLQLNNGKKWAADEHTAAVVGDMKMELSDFEKTGQSNYKGLADSLTSQLDVLVAGCTMTGPAHDELHKWLVPLTESLKDLRAAKDAWNAEEAVGEIGQSLEAFDHFFEMQAD